MGQVARMSSDTLSTKKTIQVGIIGYGKMGQIRYKTLCANKHCQVVAVAEPGSENGPTGVQRYDSAEKLITDPNVEAIFVCTPNYLNKPLVMQALKAGKHVFCEKPPAMTASDMEDICEVEKAARDIKLMYGFNHRHHESIRKAKELIDSGSFGRILWMRGRYGKSVDQNFYDNWRAKKQTAGGGILMDQGIHMLDLFLMMAISYLNYSPIKEKS